MALSALACSAIGECCGDPGESLPEEDTSVQIPLMTPLPTPALEFDHSEGTMPPHSQDTVYLTARPKVRSNYSWTISYCLLSQRGTGALGRDSVPGKERKEEVNCEMQS